MVIPRSVALIAAVLVALVVVAQVAPTSQEPIAPLPPIFTPGEQVVSPLGELFTVQTVQGEWFAVAPSPLGGGFSTTGGFAPGSRWVHAPTGNIWTSAQGLR